MISLVFHTYISVLNLQTLPEIRYNRAQIKTNRVERTFGIWKRFPCLSRGMGNKLETIYNIIIAAVLHNIALILKNILPLNENLSLEFSISVDIHDQEKWQFKL